MLLNVSHLLLFSRYPLKLSVPNNTFCIWSYKIMARIVRSGCLNLLVLLVVSTNLMNSLDAQPLAPAPEPVAPAPKHVAPAPEPVAPAPKHVAPAPEHVAPAPEHVAPAPEPVAPAPEPVAPDPHPVAPAPEPVAPAPVPLSEPATQAARGGSSGLRGGQKAGIVIGVLVGAVLIGLGGLVCLKRQTNIRRSSYSNAARNFDL